MDKSTFCGLLIALGGIVVGLMLEGGRISQVLQPTAAMIVFGGTIGAVMVQFPMDVIMQAVLRLRLVFWVKGTNAYNLASELVIYAQKARKQGIVSLDADLDRVSDPFMKRALMLAVDGTHPEDLRALLESEIDCIAERDEQVPKVFDAAGGFAPTVGIIGAVLGLIQVMQHLQNIDEVGRGIAVAFVATIYGVASANLFFLPAAGKLKIRIREEQLVREMTLEGVISILEGMNPRMLETKLHGMLQTTRPSGGRGAKKAAPGPREPVQV
jgi:chemotaxis protein MotA